MSKRLLDLDASLALRFYLLGYSGILLPRPIRRLFARRELHRAWLSGQMGLFEEDGKRFTVCSRDWLRYRKGVHAKSSSLSSVCLSLLNPYSV